MRKENRPNTYNRIIDESLVLFNEQGERNISTNHIASHLGISPGNLYYHFANKDEIIMQLFKRYSTELLNHRLETPLPHSASELSNYIMDVLEIMWKYRFFFSDVNTLLLRNAQLLQEYNALNRDKVWPLLENLLEEITKYRLIDTDAVARYELAMNLWLITKYWFNFDSSLHECQLSNASKYRGTRQILSLFRSYMCAEHRTEFTQVINKLTSDYPD